MYKAIDIAKWFINYNLKLRNVDNEDTDNITNLKLQKLLYYAQGSMLALKDKLLFNNDIVAWSQKYRLICIKSVNYSNVLHIIGFDFNHNAYNHG